MIKFKDIEQFPTCPYSIHVAWIHLEKHIEISIQDFDLDLDPDFQRDYVWNTDQQIKYCEYILHGGTSGKELYFNCPNWGQINVGSPYVIIDGKQRLHAVRLFMSGKIPVFGHYIHEFEDRPDMLTARFVWNVAAIDNRIDVLRWYIKFNSGGTYHTEKDLDKVRKLIEDEIMKINPKIKI